MLLVELLETLLVEPHVSDSNVVLRHERSVVAVSRLRSEQVGDVCILRYHNTTATQPCSERDLHILSSPHFQLRIHLTLIPPGLGDSEHAHRDGSKVIG